VRSVAFLLTIIGRVITTKGQVVIDFLTIRKSNIFDKDHYLQSLNAENRGWVRRLAIFHYLIVGEPSLKSPNPLFMPEYYRGQLKSPPRNQSLLVHYIKHGSFCALRPNPFFSGLYYVENYHDVLANGQHPLAHYYWHGWREGRNPHPAFHTNEYVDRYKINRASGQNPLARVIEDEKAIPSELWGLDDGVPTTTEDVVQSTPVSQTVDLIVPVYRRPDLVENLFDSLTASPDWDQINNCIVVDDCGDSFTTKYLRELAARISKIKLIKNESNLGFLRSVNKAWHLTSSQVVILVNSDVQVPKFWLSRLVAPLTSDSQIAIVTPLATSGANLSVALRPGQSWVDADRILSGEAPKFPDACTAIGYLMAIRRAAITTKDLFDDIFQHGYGEDTDLHYRLLRDGHKSVICDNLLILHRGSASYLLDDQKSKIYDQNRKIFFERWGSTHQACHEKFIQENALGRILTKSGHTRKEAVDEAIDVLFVSPTNDRAIGGVKIIFEMASYLCDHGIKAKVFCTEQTALISTHAHDSIMPIFRKETLYRLVKSVKIVVGTGIGVAADVRLLAEHYRSRRWWLVQGPECYFGNGLHYRRFVDEVLSADHVITVSEYLTNLVKDFGAKSITTLPLGPDHLAFYPRDVEREPNSIAIHLIDTPDKGSRFAISWAEEAKRRGMTVHFFGSSRLYDVIPEDLGVRHGKLDGDGLAKLFSRCQYYLDLSLMEGLGLLPLEAYFCGCTPVMTRKGAPDLIFGEDKGVVWLKSHLAYEGFSLSPSPPNLRMLDYQLRASFGLFARRISATEPKVGG
jgi:GT2 family glycosyltransferase